MKLRSLYLSISVIIMLFVINSLAIAQPGGPGGGGDPDVPITGIEILILLGGALGIKRLLGFNKKSKE